MIVYLIRRILLIIPTLLGIMVANFLIIQAAPGGPVEQAIAQLQGYSVDATARVSGIGHGEMLEGTSQGNKKTTQSKYRGAQGLDPEIIRKLERMYNFDKPAHERLFKMLWQYMRFDFGKSFFRDRSVVDLVLDTLAPADVRVRVRHLAGRCSDADLAL